MSDATFEDWMSETSPAAKKLNLSDILKLIVGGIFLYYFGPIVYKDFLASEPPPATIGPNALGMLQLGTIINTSKTNEIRFKSDYVGKQFTAYGSFKESNKDWKRYHIGVTVGPYVVACETNDAPTLEVTSRLAVGDPVRIYGLIDDTWMGDLPLKQCAVTR